MAGDETHDEVPTRPDRRSVSVWDHLGALASVAIITLTALRLLRVAHGDHPTAFAIVQHAGTTNALAGLLVTVFPMLGTGAALLFMLWHELSHARLDRRLVMVPLTVTVLFIPLLYAAGILLGWLAAHVVASFRWRGLTEWPRLTSIVRSRWYVMAISATPLIVTTFNVLVVDDSMWMPREIIAIQDEDRPLVGYLLSDDDDRTVILTDTNREIAIFDQPWTSRDVCSSSGNPALGLPAPSGRWYFRTIPALLNDIEDGPTYRKCPS